MSTGPFSPEHPGQGRDNLAAAEIDSQGLDAVPQLPGHVDWPSYEFLEFDESSLEQEDRTFLANKGSLSVPEAAALDEFVRHYFLHLHPILPLLDEAEFWNSYTQCGNKSKISLLVLQAMLFAGCPYISLNTLQRCGFNSKRDARSHFYKRAKFLFGLAEYHPVVRTQAAILLSHHASAAEPRAGSEWLALAIQNAHLIDRIPGRRPTGDTMQRKRLWWSIILRDRYLCLTLHRRTQVPEIPRGLDLDALDEDVLSCEIQSSLVYDPEEKVILVKILKEYYELALALSDMVPLVYASHGINTASLSGDACMDNLSRAKGAKRSLEEWKSSTGLPVLMAQVTREPATLFANLIHMYYYAARINLAHFELLIMQQQPEFVSGYDEKLRNITSELHSYMSQQSIIMEYLGHCGRSQILPLSVIGCLPMPLLTTAINISLSPSPHQREIHKRRIDTFGQIVRNLEQVYEAATMISSGMSHFLQLAYTTIQLSSEPEPVLPSNSAVYFEAGPTNEHQTTPAPPTWKEFLLQSPQAYLLISTTVDFSLSLGHLPRTDSLPDLLTCLLPRCLRICLPWDNNPVSSARSPDNVQEYFELNSRQNPPPNRGGRERSRMEVLNRFRMQQQAKRAEEEFNLDYLDLSAVG